MQAIEDGNGINWLQEKLLREFTSKRARVIARTETTRARNAGYATAGDNVPFQTVKIWNSAQDARTRNNKHASHLLMDLQQREPNEYFEDPVSKALMMFPGDSSNASVSAADTINCRCRVTFLAKEDANGDPIPK
jgi:hypothetical protein